MYTKLYKIFSLQIIDILFSQILDAFAAVIPDNIEVQGRIY